MKTGQTLSENYVSSSIHRAIADAQLLALEAKREEENAKMQEKINQLMKLNQQNQKQPQQETVQTIITPAANPVSDLFKKHKMIIIIGTVVFLLLIIILLIV